MAAEVQDTPHSCDSFGLLCHEDRGTGVASFPLLEGLYSLLWVRMQNERPGTVREGSGPLQSSERPSVFTMPCLLAPSTLGKLTQCVLCRWLIHSRFSVVFSVALNTWVATPLGHQRPSENRDICIIIREGNKPTGMK